MEQEDKELYQEILVEKEDVGQNLMDDPFNPANSVQHLLFQLGFLDMNLCFFD